MSNLAAKVLAEQISQDPQNLGLDINDCVTQCYDGASVMSGKHSGVQMRLREIVGHGCLYIHSNAHTSVLELQWIVEFKIKIVVSLTNIF